MSKVVVQKPAIGFYGKIPSVGDFVHRGLAGSSIALMDGWLQRGMASMRSSSQDPQAGHMVSPITYFIMPEKIWAESPVTGLFVPSVDRVGRQFPLLMMTPLQENFRADCSSAIGSLKRATDSALGALHDRLSPDALYSRLTDEEAPQDCSDDPEFMRFSSVLHAFAANSDHSFWWQSEASAGVRVLECSATPDEQLFCSLLAGLATNDSARLSVD